jgi:hypothetical protein
MGEENGEACIVRVTVCDVCDQRIPHEETVIELKVDRTTGLTSRPNDRGLEHVLDAEVCSVGCAIEIVRGELSPTEADVRAGRASGVPATQPEAE